MTSPILTPEHLYLVEWLDPSNRSGWMTRDELLRAEGPIMISVGWFLGDNSQGEMVIGMDFCRDDGHYNNVGYVPRSLVKKVTELRIPAAFKPRKKRVKKEVEDVT